MGLTGPSCGITTRWFASTELTVRVEWPDGTERTVDSVEANQRVVIPQEGPVRPVTAES